MEMDLIREQSLSAGSYQHLSFEQREWMDDPWSKVPLTETLSNVSFISGTRRSRPTIVPPNVVVKQLRRDLILGDVEVNVIGPSGAGKSQILEGINDLFDKDEYLALELRRRGLTLKRRAIPFSMGIKAAQIPKEQGGPGIIPLVDQNGEPIIHGKFTDQQYADGSGFIGKASEEVSKKKGPRDRLAKFREAPGAPFITKKGIPVKIEGMANRGNTPIYESAYGPDRRGKYIFIVVRQDRVGDAARVTRKELDPEGDMQKVFNSGIDYVATNREGVVEHIADAPVEIQRDTVRLLRNATANDKAIERSNGEYREMLADLQKRGIIPDADGMSYARALRNQLMWAGGRRGLPGSQIYIVSNFYSKTLRDNNTYNLDYFLKDNHWALTYGQLLVPPSLCELYLPEAA